LLHTEAEHVIPALTNALASTNANLRRDAARALGEFRWQAVSAAPLLQALTNNPATKAEALEAMKKIQLSAPASDKP